MPVTSVITDNSANKLTIAAMNKGGSGDYKIKLYLAVKELVGVGSITERLRRATWGIAHLIDDDFPSSIRDRVMALKTELTQRHGLLGDEPRPVPDEEAAKLAEEFTAVFAVASDTGYFGRVLVKSAQ
jgi:hypothetical protein